MTKSVKFIALFVTLALAVASANTFTVTLFQPSMVAGQELKPGDYKVTVENEKAIISKGKEKVEAAVKVENADTKFNTTSVRYSNADGKMKVTEIRVGGSTTRVLFN
jgi:hypothetical protein